MIFVMMSHSTMFDDGVPGIILFSFHMPAFFIVSGFFIEKKKLLDSIKRDAKKLLLPYIIVVAVGNVCNWIFSAVTQSKPSFFTAFKFVLSSDVINIRTPYACWFLLALFWGKLLIQLALRCKYPGICVLAFVAAGYISLSFVELPLYIAPAFIITFYLYIGVLIRKYNVISRSKPWMFVAAAVVWGIFVYPCGLMNIDLSIYHNFYHNILLALFPSYALLGLMKYFYNKFKNTAFMKLSSEMGRETLIILCAHTLCGFFTDYAIEFDYGIAGNIFALLLNMFISLIPAYILVKYKKEQLGKKQIGV